MLLIASWWVQFGCLIFAWQWNAGEMNQVVILYYSLNELIDRRIHPPPVCCVCARIELKSIINNEVFYILNSLNQWTTIHNKHKHKICVSAVHLLAPHIHLDLCSLFSQRSLSYPDNHTYHRLQCECIQPVWRFLVCNSTKAERRPTGGTGWWNGFSRQHCIPF